MTLSPTPLRHPLKWSRPLVGRGSPSTHGWIIDAYGDYDRDSMVLWLWNEQGAHRIEDPGFLPTFFLHAPPAELPALRRRIEILDGVREVREVERRIALEDEEPRPVLEIVPRHYRDLPKVARILDSNGGYVDHKLFNVDLRPSQRYMMEHGIFPMGLVRHANGRWTPEEEHFALDYPLPPLRRSLLDLHVDNPMGIPRMQDRLLGARVEDDEVDGDEESILRGIEALVRSKDPDVLLTDGGDAFTMPYLARKVADLGMDLQLGRDRDRFAERKGKSYFTYGKIVYKPGQYLLRGRLHLDRGHFAYRESALAGLAELSRLSTLTPQEQARLTPGTAISAMQVNLAVRDGCLVIWKKNRPEDFKTAEDLVLGDRGGVIFEPEGGLAQGLYELDFSALYPSIMVKYNISPECLDCPCCDRAAISVPGLKYHLCTSRVGLIPRVLKPILERRRYYKKMKKEPGPLEEVYRDRDAILKWLLVTTFRLHRVQECAIWTNRVPRGNQRIRAGPSRPYDGNRGESQLRCRARHRGLHVAPRPGGGGSDPTRDRPPRRLHGPHNRARGPLQVDCVPPVQDDRRGRAEPVLRPPRQRGVQAPGNRTPEARHSGIHQRRAGGDARRPQRGGHRRGVPRADPEGGGRPPVRREADPRQRDPAAGVHPHEERHEGPRRVRRPHRHGRRAAAAEGPRVHDRAGRERAVPRDGHEEPGLRGEGEGRGVPGGERAGGDVGVHPAPVPLRADPARAVRVHGGAAPRGVPGPQRPRDRPRTRGGDRRRGGLQDPRGGQRPQRGRVPEGVAGGEPAGAGGRGDRSLTSHAPFPWRRTRSGSTSRGPRGMARASRSRRGRGPGGSSGRRSPTSGRTGRSSTSSCGTRGSSRRSSQSMPPLWCRTGLAAARGTA